MNKKGNCFGLYFLIIIIGLLFGYRPLPVDAATVIASGTCGENVTWELDSEGSLTISGTGAMTDYSQDNKAPWYETYVEPYLNAEQGKVTSIVIDDGVTGIGDYAFYNCRHVISADIPESAIIIGEYSFSHCESLGEMVIPKQNSKLGSYAFESCSSLKTVSSSSCSDSRRVGSYVFKDCVSLTSITFPSNICYGLDYTSFEGCTSLKEIKFAYTNYPGPYVSVEGILVKYSSSNSSNNSIVTCPQNNSTKCSVLINGQYEHDSIYYACDSRRVQAIGDYALYNCKNATDISLEDYVRRIGVGSFQKCINLKSINLGKDLESIEKLAFAECTQLESITIPGCVGEIGKNAFSGCTSLSTIFFRGDAPSLTDSVFSSDVVAKAYYPGNNSTWTQSVMESFGGNITWEPYTPTLTALSEDSYKAEIDETSLVYNGDGQEPDVNCVVEKSINTSYKDNIIYYSLTPDVNYFVRYENNVESGTGTVVIDGKGEYSGTLRIPFAIKPKVNIEPVSGTYNGKPQNLLITAEGNATLYFNSSLSLSFDNYLQEGSTQLPSRTSAGSTKVYYIAVPNKNPTEVSCVSGETQLTIEKASQVLNVEISSAVLYEGDNAEVSASATAGAVSFSSSNQNVLTVDDAGIVTAVSEGEAYITVSAASTSNYYATEKKIYVQVNAVEEKSITECSIPDLPEITYTGNEIKPEITIKDGDYELKKDKDYSVKYSNNINVGTAKILVTGQGRYIGSTIKQFTIKKAAQSLELKNAVNIVNVGETVQLELTEQPTGSLSFTSSNDSIATVDKTGLVAGISEGNVEITISAEETDNYLPAQKKIAFKVTVTGQEPEKNSIKDCQISLTNDLFTYDGKEKKPGVTVRNGTANLEINQDYTLTYPENMTDAGTLTVTVTGMGNYTDTKDLNYEILQASPVLKFEVSEVTKTTEDGSFTNSLDVVTDGVITYSSGNTAVATVNSSTGKVTIVGSGTTVIRAVAVAGKNYKAGEGSYNLTVIEKEETLSLSLENLSYSFGNIASSFGYPEKYMYPLNIYEMIFGKTTKATFWYDRDMDITGGKWRGNCAGFSGTAALMMDPSSGIKVQDFESSATSIGQLNSKSKSLSQGMDVTGFIEAMQIAQHTQLFCNEISKNRIYTSKHLNKKLKNLNGFYETVRMETEAGRPVLLALYQTGAHAVLAYEVKDISETESQILLYDSNWPEKERALTLKKDADGNFMEWFYEIGGSYGTWGTDTKNSSISYVPYSVIKEIWATKGQLKENENVLSINSGSVAIYTSGDKPVATVTQGELSTTIDDIQVIDYLSLERADSDTLLLSVPVDVYTFKNLDMSVDEFEIAITNTNLGASAVTTADSITMAVDDSCNLNAVYIDASEDDDYSITLNSSFSYDENNVVVTGKGNGEMMEVSQTKGNININNCQITSISIDGKEIGKYKVKALVGEGGKITPEGETVVAEGESVSYNIEPSSGYAISDVLVDGRSVGAVSTYAFNNVTADHEIKALFKKKEAPKIPIENSMNQTPSNQLTPVIVNPKNPTGTTLKKLKRSGSGKMTVTWKKNNTVTGYQISYSTSSNFKKAKIVTIMNKKTTKTVLKKLNKKKKYYVRIRTYKNVGGKRYYSAWSKKKGG